MTPSAQILFGAISGALAGLLLWRWLRTGGHRRLDDRSHLTLSGEWEVVPMAAAGGAIAGTVALHFELGCQTIKPGAVVSKSQPPERA